MKKISNVALVLLCVLLLPLIAHAQDASPPPDPLSYDDPAMHYAAPPGAVLLGGQMLHPTLDALSQDLMPIAQWVVGRPPKIEVIALQMETFSGPLSGFVSQFENNLRGNDSATLVKHSELTQLTNGMPVEFIEVTQGAGFETHKIFAYLWIDGQRGVVLGVECTLGVTDADSARQLLTSATAVRYPLGR